ncbi:MAG: hypothetical protein ACRD40_06455, partial [Candidatus Acidiferrales bacterium]
MNSLLRGMFRNRKLRRKFAIRQTFAEAVAIDAVLISKIWSSPKSPLLPFLTYILSHAGCTMQPRATVEAVLLRRMGEIMAIQRREFLKATGAAVTAGAA